MVLRIPGTFGRNMKNIHKVFFSLSCIVDFVFVSQVFVCLWKGCKVYNTPSTSQSWLQRHMLTHSGDKPFKVTLHSSSICPDPLYYINITLFQCVHTCDTCKSLCASPLLTDSINHLCACSVWWGAATPRLPHREDWHAMSPLTSVHRVQRKCPVRAK